jgi:hypothetical protein
MERQPPVAPADEIDLYIRTYTSLLRSTGDVDIRAFEEAHGSSASSLHEGALSVEPDVSAFAYAAGRLPLEMPRIRRVVLGQSHELFEAAGFDVRTWRIVKTRGRRRPLRWDGATTLGVFIASASDIDDLVPMLTAYQIEWNKMHARLRTSGSDLPRVRAAAALALDDVTAAKLVEAFGGDDRFEEALRLLAGGPLDLKIRMLAASHSQYQRAAQRWWSGVEPAYIHEPPRRRPAVYFVSSNTHAIANLLGGYALAHADPIVAWARHDAGTARGGPRGEVGLAGARGGSPLDREGLADDLDAAAASGDAARLAPVLYYLLRGWIHADPSGQRMREVRAFEQRVGVAHVSTPGHVDVDAQLIEIARLEPACLDPRLRVAGAEALRASDAVILNIDYPLGMAAYYCLSRLGQGVGELRGVYVMGKAATLNGRVGDVSLSGVCYDEHSRNTFLFRNAFGARDVAPWLQQGSVFDNQAALTVRSAFLQNRRYMTAFYRDGYTVLEMEAGPFLGAVYELIYPHALPRDEIVHLSDKTPFDVGFLHYVSDTPYSRRQSLLSKSLSYFGVDSTYACAIAIVRRILEQEVQRVGRAAT